MTAYGRQHRRAKRLASSDVWIASQSSRRGRDLWSDSGQLTVVDISVLHGRLFGCVGTLRCRRIRNAGCERIRDGPQSTTSAGLAARFVCCVETSLSSRRGRKQLWARPGQTTVNDVCKPGGSPLTLSWKVSLSCRGRVMLSMRPRRSTIDDVAGHAAQFLLTRWDVSLSSHRGCCCGRVRDILQPTTSAGRTARFSCGVGTPAVISLGTCHSR